MACVIDIHGMDGVVGDDLSDAGLLLLVREPAGQIDALRRCVAHLERELSQCRAELAAARKNSSNSSKPPSGDITRPPRRSKRRGKSKRKIGGQPNHPRHQRPPFPPDQVDQVHDHTLDHCPDCGGDLAGARAAPRVIQQAELLEKPIRIDEHRAHAKKPRINKVIILGFTCRWHLNAGCIGCRMDSTEGRVSSAGDERTVATPVGCDVGGLRGRLCRWAGEASQRCRSRPA